MRDILFRGKRVDNGKWVEGHYGEYYSGKENVSCISIPKETISGSLCYDVIPETVGQYTGMKDLHGTRIFEGDVVRLQNLKRLYEVYWNKKEARYKARNGSCVSPLCNGYNVFIEEVVGNVFDNPELLKGSAKNE